MNCNNPTHNEYHKLIGRNPGEPAQWPLYDKLRLLAIEIDTNSGSPGEHEIPDDLRRAADIIELHTIHTLEESSS